MAVFEGGCECGMVRYRITSEPIFVNCCHCRDCQKITGSAFALNALIEADRVEVLRGNESINVWGDAARCAECQTLLWAEHRLFDDRIKFLRVGTLDKADMITPDAHFFVRSKHPWITIPQGIPAYETLPATPNPSAMSAGGRARLEAAKAGQLAR